MALAQRAPAATARAASCMLVGITGACLFFGDGIITPAISVLSAMEGLKVDLARLRRAIIRGSVVILVALFLVQYRGTGTASGAMFGPVWRCGSSRSACSG